MAMSRSIWLAMKDDIAAGELVSTARLHCKLALEHGRATTSLERRRAIIKEIEGLRAARNALLERFAERESV
ncbi:hypothetical protein A7K91_00085 [Paenibacillus oryzae]|uniref:Uncharacterized protein n=1 Tax=Paenibacillus oryzae TaxID=1844972 RepID=A0A1A5YM76_9BACL|nr:hypothetical protein [Paenibacillus oryzae]OBR66717.1 hypothetical protein A7K91_00085 [Paenibacillus oryzae]